MNHETATLGRWLALFSRRNVLALLGAIASVSAACGGGDTGDAAAAEPEPTASATATPEEVTAAAEDPAAGADESAGESGDGADASDGAGAGEATLPATGEVDFLRALWEYGFPDGPNQIESELGYSPRMLQPGEYATNALVTPMSFTIDEPWRMLAERQSFFALVDNESLELWRPPLLEWIRPQWLVDPALTSTEFPDIPKGDGSWDFDAWFDAHPDIEIIRTDLLIGGVESVQYDVTLAAEGQDGWECGPGIRCVPLMVRFGSGPFTVASDELLRLYVIPQGDHAPIVGYAIGIVDEGFGDFLEEVDALVASIELGEPQPVGFAENFWEDGLDGYIPAGPATLPILNGVSFELPEEYWVRQALNWSYIEIHDAQFNRFAPNVEVAAAIQSVDGTPIESAEQLADLLVERVGGVRLPDAELAGRRAVVVDMLGVRPGIPVFRHIETPVDVDPGLGGWFTQDFVNLWAVDTDDGVLIVTAEAEDQAGLDVALQLQEAVRTSLEIS